MRYWRKGQWQRQGICHSHRRPVRTCNCRSLLCRFNGATTFQPWKSRPFFGPSRCRKISLFREVHEWCLSTKGPMPGKAILFAFPIIVSSASQDSDHHLTSRKPFILLLPFSPSPPDEHPGTLSCPLPVPQAAPGPRSSPCPRHA